ncbi:MAG: beta-ketoacyl-[acyl-carrier-protein] synthase family protein, partial [Acidimicrobiales bacterium]
MVAKEQIVVTGMAVVTPAGCSLDELWTVLCSGESMVTLLPPFDDHGGRHLGSRVRGFDGGRAVTRKDARRMDLFAQFGVAAALAAYEDAGCPTPDPDRGAIVSSTVFAGQATHETETRHFVERGHTAVNPLMVPMTMPNAAVARVAIRLGWHGPTMSTTGDVAVGEGLELLRAGRVDVVIAGGMEAAITPVMLTSFANLQALSRRVEDPAGASRPFDADRDGFVMGEGAAFVVLER